MRLGFKKPVQHLLPSFFIIGERKCATSSLYRYLMDHPQVLPCRIKEPQFFSKPWWYRMLFTSRYRALFPLSDALDMKIRWFDLDDSGVIIEEELLISRDPRAKVITGEASANTFAQVPPDRLRRAFPEARLILCLRHPVDRAFSHYQMLKRFSAEGRRIPFQFTDFKSDFEIDFQRSNGGGQGYFAGLSLYTDRLKKWSQVFGNENICIVRAEDLGEQNTARRILSELCQFLDIRKFDFEEILQLKVNKSEGGVLDPDLGGELFKYYVHDIQALQDFTGRKFNWAP